MKIVVVVDMQNDFITGPLGSPEAIVARDNLEKYLKTLAEYDKMIIFTRDTHFEDYMETQEGKNLPIQHCIVGTNGWEIDKKLLHAIKGFGYSIIGKSTFGSIDLIDEVYQYIGLDSYNTDEIIICGVCTDICVISNALILKAAYPETEISVLANCCAGVIPEKHEAALSVMESCQINIIRE